MADPKKGGVREGALKAYNQKKLWTLPKLILLGFVAVLIIVMVLYVTGVINLPHFGNQNAGQSNVEQSNGKKIIFTLLAELPGATEGTPYPPYSFCAPNSARSGATCGALAGVTTNPVGGSPPYLFSVQFGKGFLPPGLVLELNGLLSGTPTLAGTYHLGICAKDGYDETCKTTSLTVKPKSAEGKIAPSIKIESATATLIKVDKWGAGSEDRICTVKISGTITGPVCSFLQIADGRDPDGAPGIRLYPIECPDWRYWDTSPICSRDPDNPITTKWSITFDRRFGEYTGGKAYEGEFVALIDIPKLPLTNEYGGNLCAEAEVDIANRVTDSVFLTC
jgi:hypothetical protein